MRPRKTTYLVHRWLGLAVSLQLLAWSVGGFIFSVFQIDAVRGEREIRTSEFDALTLKSFNELPQSLRDMLQGQLAGSGAVGSVALVDRGLGPTWEVRSVEGEYLAKHYLSGERKTAPITAGEAKQLAVRDFAPEANVPFVELIHSDPPIEYRSKPLPAFKVSMDHTKQTHIYVVARTGAITARRNRQWRVFDLFWMLHTMDYGGRDDFIIRC